MQSILSTVGESLVDDLIAVFINAINDPSKYIEITKGCTYDFLQIAAVLPSFFETNFMASTKLCLACVTSS